MNLKLSNLLAIIAIIFFLYYYFIHLPQEKALNGVPAEEEQQHLPQQEQPFIDNGVTQLLHDSVVENFAVTPIDNIIYQQPSLNAQANTYDTTTIYDVAGNVRPDNVMFAGNEPATSF